MTRLLILLLGMGFAIPANSQLVLPRPPGTLTVVNNGPGRQTDPHVSGNIVVYTEQIGGTSVIRYHDLATGADLAIPSGGAYDYLPDVHGSRVVFTRQTASAFNIHLFDIASAGPVVELAPAPDLLRDSPAIGASTVVWVDGSPLSSPSQSDLVVHDLAAGSTTNLTNDSYVDGLPAVSPGGDAVAWTKCPTGSGSCNIWVGRLQAGAWSTSELIQPGTDEFYPDTDGETVVYSSSRGGDENIHWRPIGGGPERTLSLAGIQTHPTISRGLVAFDHLDISNPVNSSSDIYVYDMEAHVIYPITDTPDRSESLNDVWVGPDGIVHVVWSVGEGSPLNRNVYAFTFHRPLWGLLLFTGEHGVWKSTGAPPAAGWESDLGYDDRGWTEPYLFGGPIPSACAMWQGFGPPCDPSGRFAWFRAKFQLPGVPPLALLDVSVDDDCDIWVNGQRVVSDHDCQPTALAAVDVSPYLVAGENLIAVAAEDCGQCRRMQLVLRGAVDPGWLPGGTPLAKAGSTQQGPVLASDGSGGVIAAWQDQRGGASLVYAQRVTGGGTRRWTTEGIPAAQGVNSQARPQIVPAGAEVAIVAWEDAPSGETSDIYAARVAPSLAPWGGYGVGLCTAANDQRNLAMVPDGAGGAIAVWEDHRSGAAADLYAQRLSGAGLPLWTPNGVQVCTATGDQTRPSIAGDGAGGAVVAWQDARGGSLEVRAQRIDANGATQWLHDGIRLTVPPGQGQSPVVVRDQAGGFVVAWEDPVATDIYAQRLLDTGSPQWGSGGRRVVGAPNLQVQPVMAPDQSGGVYIAWRDRRSDPRFDLYVQGLDIDGTPLWQADGMPACAALSEQDGVRLILFGGSGLILAWEDDRNGTKDVYAQRLDMASGLPMWTLDGIAVCTAPGTQSQIAMLDDGAAGAILAWQDERCGSDIFATRVPWHGGVLAVGGPGAREAATALRVWPNPCTGAVTIAFRVPVPMAVRLEIFDVSGRRVHARTLHAATAGAHSVLWDGRGSDGQPQRAGVYYARVRGPGLDATARGARLE